MAPHISPSSSRSRTRLSLHALLPLLPLLLASAAAAQTSLHTGETRFIALPPSTAPLEVPPNAPFQILGPPQTSSLANRTFIRIKGLSPSTATLKLGPTSTTIQVLSESFSASAPTIFAPTEGAHIWGTIAIGVEAPDSPSLKAVELQLSIPNSSTPPRTLASQSLSPQGWGPLRAATFDLNADEIEADFISLTPITINEDGTKTPGSPTRLTIDRPSPSALIKLEAETDYQVERPRRFADNRISIGMDKACSNGKFLSNYSAEPAMCAPLAVETSGWYQVIGTFGGSSAAGTLPTVSFVIDGAQYGATNTRIIRESWHRVPLGIPVRLEAGQRIITPYFETDFYVERLADRNLKTDCLELLRIADADTPASDANPMMASPAMMSGAMSSMMSGATSASTSPDPYGDPYGEQALPLRIAFERPFDGQSLPGEVRISGRVWWPNIEDPAAPAPIVSLVINGTEVLRQRTAAPVFEPDSSLWQPGRNTVQLLARLTDGSTATTPIQTVTWSGPIAETESPHFLRFPARDPLWTDASRALVGPTDCDERQAFRLLSNSAIDLPLPTDLTGRFMILLEGRGESFQGPATAELSLLQGETVTPIKSFNAPTWWGDHEAAPVDLAAGAKTLRIAFTNDRMEKGKGDRNLFFQAVSLRRIPASEDRTAPTVRITYPSADSGWQGFLADAIVLEAADDRTLVEAELIIDGVQTGLSRWMPREFGRVVLPIMGRTLEPGPHTIAVRVRDEAGNTTTSADFTFDRLAAQPEQLTRYQRAVRLLDRFAYGPDESELAAILTLGEDRWLRDRLTSRSDELGDLAALGRGLAFYRNQRSEYDVKGRAIQQAIGTTNPVRSRFVFWAQNHFSTWVSKTEGERKWAEHVAFAKLGVAPFADLLYTSATGPAMLRYLDQDVSFAGRINENYAREIMELHTLGVHGGYTQADVTALAHLLTGWTSAQIGDGRSGGELRLHSFRFDPALADGKEATILGVTFPAAERAGRFDRVRSALDLLAAHPSTATFVCTKLAAHYVSSPPDESLVRDLASVFESTGGDMREVLLALASHPAFWTEASPRLAHPLDYALRAIRITNANNPWAAMTFLDRSGSGLFDRATPDGYPSTDATYADSNSMVQRWALAHELRWPLSNLAFPQLRWGNATQDPNWAQHVIDSAAIRLTGNVLGDASNAAMLTAAGETEGSPHDRCRAITELVAKMPEANLR